MAELFGELVDREVGVRRRGVAVALELENVCLESRAELRGERNHLRARAERAVDQNELHCANVIRASYIVRSAFTSSANSRALRSDTAQCWMPCERHDMRL